MERYVLPNGVAYEVHEDGVRTVFPDGRDAWGVPSFDAESTARARALGYRGTDEEAVRAMTRDHDLVHSLVALAIDGGESHALRYADLGVQELGRIPLEERLVFLVQRALQVEGVGELLAGYK